MDFPITAMRGWKRIAFNVWENEIFQITAVSNQWSLAGINPGGNTNPDPTLVEFSEKKISMPYTVRQLALLPFRFFHCNGIFQNSEKWGFPVQMQRWMHPGCGRRKSQIQVFQKVWKDPTGTRQTFALSEAVKAAENRPQPAGPVFGILFHQPFQTVLPVTGVSNPSQPKDVLDECLWDRPTEPFGDKYKVSTTRMI